MNVKMIVMDLDKTLLRSDNSISEYTKNILDECKKRGIITAINSARPERAIVKIEKMIGCDSVICLNGGLITIDGKTMASYMIDKDIAKSIIDDINKNMPGYKISAEINDFIHSNFDVKTVFPEMDRDIITDFNIIENDVYKLIFWLDSDEDIEKISSILPEGVYGKTALGKFFQVMNNGASKFKGVEALAKHYNIPLSEIATFGDDHDDIDMIKYCGYGVAMEGSVKEVLDAAKFVTVDCNNDGVAKWIDENVLR